MARKKVSVQQSVFLLVSGLVLLVISSRILVWGGVGLARYFGVSDLIIGLTIVALGTSLPELAASITAVRKGEHEMALGNVLGSNLFNTLAVVGLAGVIRPIDAGVEVLTRDCLIMGLLTLLLFILVTVSGNRVGLTALRVQCWLPVIWVMWPIWSVRFLVSDRRQFGADFATEAVFGLGFR